MSDLPFPFYFHRKTQQTESHPRAICNFEVKKFLHIFNFLGFCTRMIGFGILNLHMPVFKHLVKSIRSTEFTDSYDSPFHERMNLKIDDGSSMKQDGNNNKQHHSRSP